MGDVSSDVKVSESDRERVRVEHNAQAAERLARDQAAGNGHDKPVAQDTEGLRESPEASALDLFQMGDAGADILYERVKLSLGLAQRYVLDCDQTLARLKPLECNSQESLRSLERAIELARDKAQAGWGRIMRAGEPLDGMREMGRSLAAYGVEAVGAPPYREMSNRALERHVGGMLGILALLKKKLQAMRAQCDQVIGQGPESPVSEDHRESSEGAAAFHAALGDRLSELQGFVRHLHALETWALESSSAMSMPSDGQ